MMMKFIRCYSLLIIIGTFPVISHQRQQQQYLDNNIIHHNDKRTATSTTRIANRPGLTTEYDHTIVTKNEKNSNDNGNYSSPIVDTSLDSMTWNNHDTNISDRIMPLLLSPLIKSRPHRRHLDMGDFDDINDLFTGMILLLPDFDIDDESTGMNIVGTNLKCRDLYLGDIRMAYTEVSAQRLDLTLDIEGIDLDCNTDIEFTQGRFISGNGNADIYTADNTAKAIITFTSPNFSTSPPTSTAATSCAATVSISDIKYAGDFERLVTIFKGLLGTYIERKLQSLLCEKMENLSNVMEKALDQLDDRMAPYLGTLPISTTDPLYPEQTLDKNSNGATFVNLKTFAQGDFLRRWELSTALDDLIGQGLSSLNDTIVVNPSTRPSMFERREEEGGLSLNGALLTYENQLMEIRMGGLDSLAMVSSGLEWIGKYTAGLRWYWDDITLEMDSRLTTSPNNESEKAIYPDDPAPPHVEEMTIKTGLKDVSVGLYVMFAVNADKIRELELGNVLDGDVVPCLLDAVHTVEITGLDVKMAGLADPSVSGFESVGMEHVAETVVETIFAMYEGSLMELVENAFQTVVRDGINDFVAEKMKDKMMGVDCPKWGTDDGDNSSDGSDSAFVDFRDLFLEPDMAAEMGGSGTSPYGSGGYKMMKLLEDRFFAMNETMDDTSSLTINNLIFERTKSKSGQGGTLKFNRGLDVKQRIKIGGLKANIELKLSNIKITNLDSVGPLFYMFQPTNIGPYVINNTANFGYQDPVTLQFRALIALDNEENIDIKNHFDVTINLKSMRVVLEIFMTMLESSMMGFPITDLRDLNCWLATIPPPPLDKYGMRLPDVPPSLAFSNVTIAADHLRLVLNCIECTSPIFSTLSNYSSSANYTTRSNAILSKIANFLQGTYIQTRLDRKLHDAQLQCPHSPSYDPSAKPITYPPYEKATPSGDAMELLITVLVVAVGASLIFAVIVFIVKRMVRRRHRRWIKTLSPEEMTCLIQRQKHDEERNNKLNATTRALICSAGDIPLIIRISIPFVILGNIAFFLSGHLSLGASIAISGSIAGEPFIFDNFFEFSMGRSVVDMWDAGAKELAVLICLFSGVWPYSKQLISLVLWMVPTSWVGVPRRGSVYVWLDVLGKWSFVDIFVFVMTIVAFRLKIRSPSIVATEEEMYAVDLLVVPKWGLYANMIAQLISQFTSHLIIRYHRLIVRRFDVAHGYEEKEGVADNKQEKLYQHVFGRVGRKKGKGLVLKPCTNYVYYFLVSIMAAMAIAGSICPSFTIEAFGLVGLAVESGQKQQAAATSYNIFTMASVLIEQGRDFSGTSDYVGMIILSIVLIATVLFIPLLEMLMTLIRYMRPFPNFRSRRRMFALIEALQAWQYMEVFILSIVIASWQLGPVSELLLNDYCDALDPLFATLVFFGAIEEDDAQCFRMTSVIEGGTWMLLVSALLLGLTHHFVSMAAKNQDEDDREVMEERMAKMKRGDLEVDEAVLVTEDDDGGDVVKSLPARFTDFYRWALSPADAVVAADHFGEELNGGEEEGNGHVGVLEIDQADN